MKNDDFMQDLLGSGGVRIALIGVLCILALFLLAETAIATQDFGRPANPATDTVTVNGNGQATMPPDTATISFTVQNTDDTVAAAQEATTKQANAAIDFVKSQGVDSSDVTTLSYNIYPQYSYSRCISPQVLSVSSSQTVSIPPCTESSKITGYQVSETVQVKLHDLATVGTFVQGLGKLNVQNVSGPSFGLNDPTAGYDAARADAITKAKAQAQVLAKQLGVSLGRIVNFSESSGGGVYYAKAYGMGGAAMDSAAMPTPSVPVGDNTYNASVSITYELR